MFFRRLQLLLLLLVLCLCIEAVGQGKKSICDDLFQTGQLETALECYQGIYELNSDDPLVNLRLCKIIEAIGDVENIGPYIGKIDSSSTEALSFLEYLNSNYQTLKVELTGEIKCPLYFAGKTLAEFTPPSDLSQAKAARLATINSVYNPGILMFHKTDPTTGISEIRYFPVVTDVPLPYNVKLSDSSYNLNFNFLNKEPLQIDCSDLDSMYCRVPESIAEVQVEIDDTDFDVSLRKAVLADSAGFNFVNTRYYINQGVKPVLHYQKKGIQQKGKKYFVMTSAILTVAMLLFQR
ncbi:MAG: hypothetical protein J7K40_03790 [candidate division Zixibacteria bacterium]|nr:hypothetical protein [candidate division Zixibacteria bacterium]